MSENGKIYTAGKNFTLPPAVKAVTNFTSVWPVMTTTGASGGFCDTMRCRRVA